jgi:hypothetical protein
MGDGILDGFPIIQDQTSPNLAHIPTTNILTYSEDFSNAAWVKSLITFTPNYATAPNGTQSAYRLVSSGGSYPQFYSAVTGLTVGQKYSVSFYVKSDGTTQIQQSAHISGISPTITFTPTNDWVRIEYTRTATATSHSFVIFTASGSASACSYLIWGYQVEKQSQATAYIKSDGIAAVRKATTTNLVLYSEDFSNSYYTKLNSSIVGGFSAPDGTNNARKLVEDTTNGLHWIYSAAITVINATTYNVSIFAKKGERNSIRIAERSGVAVIVDLENKVFDTIGSGVINSNITELADDWVRIEYSFQTTSTTEEIYIYAADNGNINYQGNGTSGIYIFGTQLEQQTQVETYAKPNKLPRRYFT